MALSCRPQPARYRAMRLFQSSLLDPELCMTI